MNYLAEKNVIPASGHQWVGQNREIGNKAAHELSFIDFRQAETILGFTEGLLRFVYEIPDTLARSQQNDGDADERGESPDRSSEAGGANPP